ncbi:hypothetical protein Tco_0092529 [Tanacetum coccineum]
MRDLASLLWKYGVEYCSLEHSRSSESCSLDALSCLSAWCSLQFYVVFDLEPFLFTSSFYIIRWALYRGAEVVGHGEAVDVEGIVKCGAMTYIEVGHHNLSFTCRDHCENALSFSLGVRPCCHLAIFVSVDRILCLLPYFDNQS